MGYLFVSDGVEAGALDLLCVAVQAHVPQHHDCTQQQGSGVGQVLTGDVGGSAVDLEWSGVERSREGITLSP